MVSRRFEDAIAALERAIQLAGRMPVMLASLGHVHAQDGSRERAHDLVLELRNRSSEHYVPSFCMAVILAGLGEQQEMLNWLAKAVEERSSWLLALKTEPLFTRYRSEHKFAALIREIELTGSA